MRSYNLINIYEDLKIDNSNETMPPIHKIPMHVNYSYENLTTFCELKKYFFEKLSKNKNYVFADNITNNTHFEFYDWGKYKFPRVIGDNEEIGEYIDKIHKHWGKKQDCNNFCDVILKYNDDYGNACILKYEKLQTHYVFPSNTTFIKCIEYMKEYMKSNHVFDNITSFSIINDGTLIVNDETSGKQFKYNNQPIIFQASNDFKKNKCF